MNASGLRDVALTRLDGDAASERSERVVAEVPVALLYNSEPFAVMMATPTDLEDFALGFALSEGIVDIPAEFRLVDTVAGDAGIALHAAIPQARFDALGERRRNLEGRSGCGLCGTASLHEAMRPVRGVAPGLPIAAADVRAAVASLAGRQPLNAASGGVHAAAFAHAGGLLVREDVGRHNALDKVVGAMVRSGLHGADGFAVVTSRASYEIAHKAATAGIPLVAAISAPTDLAIRVAETAGLTLVAFARGETMNVYTHRDRIVHPHPKP